MEKEPAKLRCCLDLDKVWPKTESPKDRLRRCLPPTAVTLRFFGVNASLTSKAAFPTQWTIYIVEEVFW